MFIAATFSLLTAVLAPQVPASAQDEKPIMKASETKSLSDKLRKYLSADLTYQAARGRARSHQQLHRACPTSSSIQSATPKELNMGMCTFMGKFLTKN